MGLSLKDTSLKRLLNIMSVLMFSFGVVVVVVEGYFAFKKEKDFAKYFFDSCALSAQTSLNARFATTQLLQKQMGNMFLNRNGVVTAQDFNNFASNDFWAADGTWQARVLM